MGKTDLLVGEKLLDRQRLVEIAASHFSGLQAVILTGSVVSREVGAPKDIDLIILSADIPLGSVREYTSRFRSLEIEMVGYNADHFLALSRNPDLMFFSIREIRKLIFGINLFDVGVAAASAQLLRRTKMSNKHLKQMSEKVREYYFTLPDTPVYNLEFFTATEYLHQIIFNSDIETRFSKHKYILEDARRLKNSALPDLLEAVAYPLAASRDWPLLLSEAENLLSCHSAWNLPAGPLKDSRDLISSQRFLEATFPFRYFMLSFQTRKITNSENELIDRAFLNGTEISNDALDHFRLCLDEAQSGCFDHPA